MGLIIWGFSTPHRLAARAEGQVSFESALKQYTQDGVLDNREYSYLKSLNQSTMTPTDLRLAKHFLNFTEQHRSYTRMTYTYQRSSHTKVVLNFVFAPTYSEDALLTGQTYRDVLGLISQNDALPETVEDAHRCGASAILSAHFLLYGSFKTAFERLNMNTPELSFRAIHIAQEQLYRYANTDNKPGLVTQFKYKVYPDGRIEGAQSEGEVKRGAALLGMRVQPLLGSHKQSIYQRQQEINTFWSMYPRAPLMVGVYLNQKTGEVYPPNDSNHPQNHYVLIFRENNRYWLINSGVLDNGNGSALYELNSSQLPAFLYQTHGSIDAFTRL